MNKSSRTILIIVTAFVIYYILHRYFQAGLRNWISGLSGQHESSYLLAYLLTGLPLFIGVGIIHPFKSIIRSLGLNGSLKTGIGFPLACTLPMFIGYAIVFPFNNDISGREIIVGAVAAAFFEELYYRGIFFGQLFRYSRLGFIPAITIGAIVFAVGHLYQSREISTMIGIFLTTFLGAILFAWIYAEWKYNLWVPVFLHFFMNLFWMLFSAGDNALGGLYANVFRVITIVLVIGLTVLYKLRKGEKFEVNRHTLLFRPRGSFADA
jgi:membrane protease YdiL (CAAX protease family)